MNHIAYNNILLLPGNITDFLPNQLNISKKLRQHFKIDSRASLFLSSQETEEEDGGQREEDADSRLFI